MQAALAAERERAARRGQAGAVSGIEIKEVRSENAAAETPPPSAALGMPCLQRCLVRLYL